MAIVTLLTLGSLHVLGNMLHRTSWQQQTKQSGWLDSVVGDLLAADLYHTQSFKSTSTGFLLESSAGLDPATLRQHHLPTNIEYDVQEISGRQWLVRTQRPRTSVGRDFSELVCPGVNGIHLLALEQRQEPTTESQSVVGEIMMVLVDFDPPQGPISYIIRTR